MTNPLGDRSAYIGASDVPLITGSLYLPEMKRTRWHLWAEKVRHPDFVPAPASPEVEVGKLAEPFLLAWVAHVLDLPVVVGPENTTWAIPGTPIIAHLDAIARLGEANVVPIEAKTSGLLGGRATGWSASQIPAYVYQQVQTQICATGSDLAYVVALIAPIGLRMYEVARDQAMIDRILAACDQFWRDHVLAGIPPEEQPYDEDLAVRIDRSGVIELPAAVLDLLHAYDEARRAAQAAADAKDQLRQQIITALGTAESGVVAGWRVRAKRITQRRLDADRVRELAPDIYTQCLRVSEYLRLDVIAPKEEG